MGDVASLAAMGDGFGQAPTELFGQLQKALTAGSGIDPSGFTGGRAMIPESLETTMVNVLFTQDEAKLMKVLKKKPIKSPVHQWDERSEVGVDDAPWVAEAGDSEETDQTIARKYATVKYLQTLRRVSLQATLSDMIEDPMVSEQVAGALWIVRNAEKGIIYADSSLVSLQPDGILKQIPAANIVDARGATADSEAFENALGTAAMTIRNNYGKPTDMYMSTALTRDFQRMLRDRIRFGPGSGVVASAVPKSYPTPFGDLAINDDIFIKEGTVPAASTLTAKRPSAVTVNSATPSADATNSEFDTPDAGDYFYKIVPFNQYGDGPATAYGAPTAVTVAADEKVTINVTEGSVVPTGYKVYRSKKGAANANDCRYAFSVARTGASMDIVDYNSYLPGTSDALVLNLDGLYDAIEWFQFLPLMKFSLYPTNAAVYPFLMLLFGALALKKPKQHVRIKNVSPSDLLWF